MDVFDDILSDINSVIGMDKFKKEIEDASNMARGLFLAHPCISHIGIVVGKDECNYDVVKIFFADETTPINSEK